jgi:hypothetical protein
MKKSRVDSWLFLFLSASIGVDRRFIYFFSLSAANGPARFAGPLLCGISKSHSKAKSTGNELPQFRFAETVPKSGLIR